MIAWRRGAAGALALVACGLVQACSQADAPPAPGPVLRVLMVNNPQMVDLQKLTDENFTRRTGIRVEFTVLPENDVRDRIAEEFSSQAGQYDVATLSNYEIPFYARNGWLTPLDERARADVAFDQADILAPVASSLTGDDGRLYGEPFYGESSFLMYRKDVLRARGLTMPIRPTWPQVADLAAALDGARPGMRGICLRGQPGWGEAVATLTTVWNTFGGGWFDRSWNTLLTSPQTRRATQFYVDLVSRHGEDDPARAGFTECLTALQQGKVAMWYDATSAGGALEAPDSPVTGQIGYAPAPVMYTPSSGWLYSWAWSIEKSSRRADAAWSFISWASSKRYEELAGTRLGWSRVPAGKRQSTYTNERYLAAASAFAAPTRNAIESTDTENPGLQPRPAKGIQFVDIPEFAVLGAQVSQKISAAIAGQSDVDSALSAGQRLAERVAQKYRK